MPIYTYRCSECTYQEDVFLRSLSSPEPTECSCCKEKALQRVLAKSSFQLKGHGFHNTDYHKNGSK